jgi:hypothetical protein
MVAQAGRAYRLIHRCIRTHQLHRRRARLPEAKLRVLIAPADGTPLPQLPNSSSAAVQARPVRAKDTAGFIRERYGRCRISSSARRLIFLAVNTGSNDRFV